MYMVHAWTGIVYMPEMITLAAVYLSNVNVILELSCDGPWPSEDGGTISIWVVID